METLKVNELVLISGGEFAYDAGCTIRYATYFVKGWILGGANSTSVYSGALLAEATKCP